MKIQKIEIRNYRSLHNISIYPKDILALVGREYPRVEGYRISVASKPPLVENLSVMIEN